MAGDIPMALNAGLAAWHAKRRKERRTAYRQVNARLDAAGIPEGHRAQVRAAYADYLTDPDRMKWAGSGERSGPVMPSGVAEGPAVDWSGYALADDYA